MLLELISQYFASEPPIPGWVRYDTETFLGLGKRDLQQISNKGLQVKLADSAVLPDIYLENQKLLRKEFAFKRSLERSITKFFHYLRQKCEL